MNTGILRRLGIVVSIALGMTTMVAHAEEHGGRPPREGLVLDGLYNHNHYYPRPGYVARSLPRGAIAVRYHGSPYFFHEGAWYRSGRYGFAVVSAPIGAFLPILPPYYSTVWFGGVPYYYADDVYYVRDTSQNGYVVAAPPEGVEAATDNSSDDLFTYPKSNQSTEQQSTDRYECHHWASEQTGFDPTQPLGGVSSAQVDSKRADYRRAQIACLEGRGYSVK
jgi:hypothetical protein